MVIIIMLGMRMGLLGMCSLNTTFFWREAFANTAYRIQFPYILALIAFITLSVSAVVFDNHRSLVDGMSLYFSLSCGTVQLIMSYPLLVNSNRQPNSFSPCTPFYTL